MSTVPTVAAGQIILADDHNSHLLAWTAYTPTWASSAGSVAIGNGTLSGRYRKVGKTVDFVVALTAGSTTTYGTAGAFWSFGLPPIGVPTMPFVFPLRMIDTLTLEYEGFAIAAAGGSTVELFKPVSGRILNNSPFAFGNTDALSFNGTYEIS